MQTRIVLAGIVSLGLTGVAAGPTSAAEPPTGQWVRKTSGTTKNLFSVHFIDANRGWAVGLDNTILHTTDGGSHWAAQVHQGTVPVSSYLGVRFLDSNTGWAGGGDAIMRTTNGGASWAEQGATVDSRFRNGIFPVSSTVAWVPAQNGSARWFSRFTVGVGEENFNVIGSGAQYWDMSFTDADHGWAVGPGGPIVRIGDASTSSPSFTYLAMPPSHLYGVHMLDGNIGWVVGGNGLIWKTTNGGTAWTPQTSGTTNDLRSVSFVDADTGWIVGAGGIILATTDGGDTWNAEDSGVSVELRHVFFVDVSVGYAVGEDGTILKRATAPRLSIDDVSIEEGNSGTKAATFSVTLSAASSSVVTVDYASAPGTATAGTDYVTTSGTLTFPAGVTTRPVSVPVKGDMAVEPDETFTLSLTGAVGASILDGTGVGTIVNDDVPPLPQILVGDRSVTEGDSGTTPAVFSVTLSTASASTVTVSYATVNGTAAAGSDYVGTSGALTFGPGVTTMPVSVAVIGDTENEADETFFLDLSAATNASIADGRGAGVIVSDDARNIVQFSAATYSVSEATPTATITVKRTGVVTDSLTVDYATGDGTASAGVDYQARMGTLTFAPKVATKTFTVPIVNDLLDEPDETVVLRLAHPVGTDAGLGPTDSALLTIKDNDVGGIVQFSAATYSVVESQGSGKVTVTRTGGLASGVTVAYSAGAGSASEGVDFTATSGTLTFVAKQATATFSVAIAGDATAEGAETVNLTLASPTGGATLGTRASAVLTIVDDEDTVEVGAPAYSVTEGSPAAIAVKRTGSLAGTATVHYATANGTAVSGTDYSGASGTLTFGPHVASRTVSISTTKNTLNGTDKAFSLALDAPAGGVTLGHQTGALVTIQDNDLAGVVQFGAAAYTVAESGGSATITVTRTGGTASGVVVMYATGGGTATAGTDYTETSGTLTFGASQASLSFKIPVANDVDSEGSETVGLTLVPVGGGATLGARDTAVLTISDNDGPVFQFSASSYSVREAAPQALITVRRVGALTQQATVEYATSDGSAVAGEDYVSRSGTLTFLPGKASSTFAVPIVADTRDEGDRTVNLALRSPSTGHYLGSPIVAVLTIVDDDTAGGIQFSSPVYSEVEGGSGATTLATITVVRTGGSASGATVDYATSDGTATAGADYGSASGTLTFASGQSSATFAVEVMGDAEVEGNQTINLGLSNAGGGATLGALSAARLWVVEPAGAAKLVFIHHSTGENWLRDSNGGLGLALRDNNYFVSDTNYGWGPDSVEEPGTTIGDHTDIGQWWDWFRGPSSTTYLDALYHDFDQHAEYSRLQDPEPERHNEIVVFKSCFPNSNLSGSPSDPPTTGDNPLRGQSAGASEMTVANAKGIYVDILEYFRAHQETLFVVVTAPPLAAAETTPEAAANARGLNEWLAADWLAGYTHANVAVFDFYNVLTSNGGSASVNDLGKEAGNHHRWWNGEVQHVHPVASDVSAYPTADSHPSAAGGKKATGEFVTLLNYYYNRWKGIAGGSSVGGTAGVAGSRATSLVGSVAAIAPPGRAAPGPVNP